MNYCECNEEPKNQIGGKCVTCNLPRKFKTLMVVINQSGGFHQAHHNGKRIGSGDLFSILKIRPNDGRTLQYYLDEFEEEHLDYKVEYVEKDVT